MTIATKKKCYLCQLTVIAKRAKQWARIKVASGISQYGAVMRHVGSAY